MKKQRDTSKDIGPKTGTMIIAIPIGLFWIDRDQTPERSAPRPRRTVQAPVAQQSQPDRDWSQASPDAQADELLRRARSKGALRFLEPEDADRLIMDEINKAAGR